MDIDSLVTIEDVSENFQGVLDKLSIGKDICLIKNNRPQFMIIGLERFSELTAQQEGRKKIDNNSSNVGVLLRRVGKSFFVNNYYELNDGKKSIVSIIDGGSNEAAVMARVYAAKRIFREGKEIAALENILSSNRLGLEDELLAKASEILKKEMSSSEMIEFQLKKNRANIPVKSERKEKLGILVRTTFQELFDRCWLSQEDVNNLTDGPFCKKKFRMSFTVLKELLNDSEDEKRRLIKDSYGHNRYYNFKLCAYGKQYLLCSQWIEKLHREQFEKWLYEIGFKLSLTNN